MQIDTTKVYDFLIALAVSLATELSIIGSFLIVLAGTHSAGHLENEVHFILSGQMCHQQ